MPTYGSAIAGFGQLGCNWYFAGSINDAGQIGALSTFPFMGGWPAVSARFTPGEPQAFTPNHFGYMGAMNERGSFFATAGITLPNGQPSYEFRLWTSKLQGQRFEQPSDVELTDLHDIGPEDQLTGAFRYPDTPVGDYFNKGRAFIRNLETPGNTAFLDDLVDETGETLYAKGWRLYSARITEAFAPNFTDPSTDLFLAGLGRYMPNMQDRGVVIYRMRIRKSDWRVLEMREIGHPQQPHHLGLRLNRRGDIVTGGLVFLPAGSMIYTDEYGYRSLNDLLPPGTDYWIGAATAINDQRQIVGLGHKFDSSGNVLHQTAVVLRMVASRACGGKIPDFASSSAKLTIVEAVDPVPGGVLRISWSGVVGPSSLDRIGLFEVGAANDSQLAFRYTTDASDGAGQGLFFLPPSVQPGRSYELRMFGRNGEGIVKSAAFTAAACRLCPQLDSSMTSIRGREVLVASWRNMRLPTVEDVVGVFPAGSEQTVVSATAVERPTGSGAGASALVTPDDLPRDTYELRYLSMAGGVQMLRAARTLTGACAGWDGLGAPPACDDNDPCTENDVCLTSGRCAGSVRACTEVGATGSCDRQTGLCAFLPSEYGALDPLSALASGRYTFVRNIGDCARLWQNRNAGLLCARDINGDNRPDLYINPNAELAAVPGRGDQNLRTCTSSESCWDGNPCTDDACQGGYCIHVPHVCGGNEFCTSDIGCQPRILPDVSSASIAAENPDSGDCVEAEHLLQTVERTVETKFFLECKPGACSGKSGAIEKDGVRFPYNEIGFSSDKLKLYT
jgi:hypothetical protein